MNNEKRLSEKLIPITRMECPTCIPTLEKEVKSLEGVEEARGNYIMKTLKVTYDPDKVQLHEIEEAIERIGYHIAYKRYPGVISRLKRFLRQEKPSSVKTLTDACFTEMILNNSGPVAVLFSTPTCPTCRVFKPRFEKITEKLEWQSELYEMDITSTETWRAYNIYSIPTVLIFRDGEVVERLTSLPREEEIERTLRTLLKVKL